MGPVNIETNKGRRSKKGGTEATSFVNMTHFYWRLGAIGTAYSMVRNICIGFVAVRLSAKFEESLLNELFT